MRGRDEKNKERLFSLTFVSVRLVARYISSLAQHLRTLVRREYAIHRKRTRRDV